MSEELDFTGLWKTTDGTRVTILAADNRYEGFIPGTDTSLGYWSNQGSHQWKKELNLEERLSGWSTTRL